MARLLALPGARRRLVLSAAAVQLGARAALAAFGLPAAVRLARWLGARSSEAPGVPALAWALSASASRVRGTCLTQALAALALGGPTAAHARLIVGVKRVPDAARRIAGTLEFHAWIEIDGTSLPPTGDAGSFAQLMVWSW
ncbi:MAG: lasso peptide biosynthesis B2 protein [Acidobacteria bacterium]|nr:lasso peptide biosynthesis B2 protein [Acidobacteriota bacterium]